MSGWLRQSSLCFRANYRLWSAMYLHPWEDGWLVHGQSPLSDIYHRYDHSKIVCMPLVDVDPHIFHPPSRKQC